jgi:osmotically-inducible protein OsmY
MKNKSFVLLGILFLAVGSLGASNVSVGETGMFTMAPEGRIFNAILSTPRYGVFDSISFHLDGDHVILTGYVLMPITGINAAKRVAKISGVEKVTNQIETLPLSRMDWEIRRKIYRKLFGTADLYRYALGYSPSIHIIVKHGRVILEGTVSSEEDAKLALLAARGIPGVFSIKSNLTVN